MLFRYKAPKGLGASVLAGLAIVAVTAGLQACGGGNDTPSNTGQRTETQGTLPSQTDLATQVTEAPTIARTPEPTPAPTPEEWSDESISAELDRATGLTYILSLRIYPDSIELKTASTEAQTALQEYQTAHESGDYNSIQGTIDKFANVGRTMLNLACYNAYDQATGNNYIHYRDLVRNLGSRYEHEGYLEAGTTESLMQSLAAPADCTNETILASNN